MIDSLERRILIYIPYGKDAQLASHVLESTGLTCLICNTFSELIQALGKGAGAILTVEEAVPENGTKQLSEFLLKQPTWSDLPMLVLTKTGGDSPWIRGAYERLGNLTLLERPVRSHTLVSAVRSALRARHRQYEIRTADQRKDEFLAMLAHELRNPLAPISAAADLLKLISSNAKRVEQTGDIIARQVGHMTHLIDDLLDVARVTRGLNVYHKEPLDFRQILTEAIEQTHPLITTRQHQLALHLPPSSAPVLGDRKRLIQVVTNMLGNASKYTPEGGNIVVRLQIETDQVVLDISDNGIGMTSDTASRVFELFAQAERTPDRSQGGLGLGLALVKNLVAAHEGSVQAASLGLGTGSRFTVRLPLLKSATILPVSQWNRIDRREAPIQPLRIMVVDDNIDAANMLEMFLSASGHDVSVEYMAAKAIESARRLSPQVCLLDIGLPDMDGHELARQLRTIPETAGALLIAVTGYSQELDKEKSAAAGFDYHFVKPVNTAQLADVLRQMAFSTTSVGAVSQ